MQRGDSGRPAAVAGPTLETVGIVDARDSVEPAQIIAGWIRSPDGRIVGRRPAMWVWLPEVERAYALNDVAREASDLPGVETLSPDLTISENDSAMGEVMTCLAL